MNVWETLFRSAYSRSSYLSGRRMRESSNDLTFLIWKLRKQVTPDGPTYWAMCAQRFICGDGVSATHAVNTCVWDMRTDALNGYFPEDPPFWFWLGMFVRTVLENGIPEVRRVKSPI